VIVKILEKRGFPLSILYILLLLGPCPALHADTHPITAQDQHPIPSGPLPAWTSEGAPRIEGRAAAVDQLADERRRLTVRGWLHAILAAAGSLVTVSLIVCALSTSERMLIVGMTGFVIGYAACAAVIAYSIPIG
jgi:hypothetical protein